MEIYTIGLARRTAADFFGALRQAAVTRLVDVRLHNTSQLAGFAKKGDLEFLLRELCAATYVHEVALAPTDDLLSSYRRHLIDWVTYERHFRELLETRRTETLPKELFEGRPVLLCSEAKPDRCHRRLVAEYLKERWPDITVHHL